MSSRIVFPSRGENTTRLNLQTQKKNSNKAIEPVQNVIVKKL